MALHQRSIASRFLFVLVLALPRSSESAVITVGGACNLNAAIEAANTDTSKGGCTAGSVADFLELTSAVLLKLVDNDTDGPNGLPSITSTIAIDGNGKFIARDVWSEPMPPPFRIFHVAESGDLTLENLLVVEGLVDTKGGGILNRGNLVLRSAFGGGIYADGELTVLNSTISGNTASGSREATGAGIWPTIRPARSPLPARFLGWIRPWPTTVVRRRPTGCWTEALRLTSAPPAA